MLERIANGDFSVALINVVLLASWDVLPLLLLAYGRQSLLARRIRPEFSLRKFEADELDRAVRLYKTVCQRLSGIDEFPREAFGFWIAGFPLQSGGDRHVADEREDLKAYAQHLRATITRLRRLPLQRLRAWVHMMSLRFALGRALAVDLAAFALFILALHVYQRSASAHELTDGAPDALVWSTYERSLFLANAAGACLAALVIPLFYLLRRTGLRREFGVEFCVLRELAAAVPGQETDRMEADPDPDWSEETGPLEQGADECWFTILGVAQSATTEQVREAYKALIKLSHPDRVHGLSPAIRKFAEAETQRLNAAYRQALASLT